MNDAERRALFEQYENGYAFLAEALWDISEAELDARPAPGEWSPREVVHHLADAELTLAIRLRRLLAEEQPAIMAYDQAEFARRLYYDRPIAAPLETIRSARATTAAIVRRMGESEWARAGTHSETGRYSAEDWLRLTVAHDQDHAAQIRAARAYAQEEGLVSVARPEAP